jgi:hypothetical protein
MHEFYQIFIHCLSIFLMLKTDFCVYLKLGFNWHVGPISHRICCHASCSYWPTWVAWSCGLFVRYKSPPRPTATALTPLSPCSGQHQRRHILTLSAAARRLTPFLFQCRSPLTDVESSRSRCHPLLLRSSELVHMHREAAVGHLWWATATTVLYGVDTSTHPSSLPMCS